jgi:acyl dehydratase
MTGGQMTIGAVVPALTRTIEQADMVAYGGATWDWHKLHYDRDYLEAKQLDRSVVDGQVFGALIAESIQDWLGARVTIKKLHFRFKNLVFAGETIKVRGSVVAIEPLPDGDPRMRLTIESEVLVVGEDKRVAVAPAGAEVIWQP